MSKNLKIATGAYFAPENKPSWSDVGGDDHWTNKVAPNGTTPVIQSTNRWISCKPSLGYLPHDEATGSAATDWIGTSAWWFRESWVNEYRGGSVNVSDVVYGFSFITHKCSYPSVRLSGNGGTYSQIEYGSGNDVTYIIHRNDNGDNRRVWTFQSDGEFHSPGAVVSNGRDVSKTFASSAIWGGSNMNNPVASEAAVTYCYNVNHTAPNVPSGLGNNANSVLTFHNHSGQYYFQLLTSCNTGKIYTRGYNGSSWSAWTAGLTRDDKIEAKQIVLDGDAKSSKTLADIIQELRSEIAELKAKAA